MNALQTFIKSMNQSIAIVTAMIKRKLIMMKMKIIKSRKMNRIMKMKRWMIMKVACQTLALM